MAGRIFLSGQNIHNSASALGSREPYLENGFCFCTDLTQIERTAIEQNNNNIRVNGQHFSEQLHLDLRHIDHGTACRFTALQIMLAKRHDHEICLFCSLKCALLHDSKLLPAVFFRRCLGKSNQLHIISDHRASLIIRCAGRIEYLFRCFPDRHTVFAVTGKRPAALDFMIIGIRSDKGNFFRRIERQNAVVFQQNEGFLCRFFRQCAVLRAEIVLFFFLCIRIFIRIFKQSQLVFQFQNTQATLVDQAFFYFAILDHPAQVCRINGRHHINIHACLQRFFRCIGGIFRASVGNGFQNGCKVRNQHAVKSHLAAQDIAHQPFVGARRNAVDRVE